MQNCHICFSVTDDTGVLAESQYVSAHAVPTSHQLDEPVVIRCEIETAHVVVPDRLRGRVRVDEQGKMWVFKAIFRPTIEGNYKFRITVYGTAQDGELPCVFA